jgi:probable HAF family extracellular repeat protein
MTAARSWTALALATFALSVVPPATQSNRAATPPGPYVLTDLGTFGGASAQAFDINDAGQAVGYATTSASQARAFVWQNGVMTDLGTLGGNHSSAAAINELGQVAGDSQLAGSTMRHAALWDNGAIIDLTPGSGGSAANGINDSRQIVLTTANAQAFLWQNGALTNLGGLSSGGTFASDINNAAQAVGSSYTPTQLGPLQHAFLWQNGVMTDLGVVPGTDESGASAINELGQIVGNSMHTDPDTYEVTSRAFLYDGGVMTALPVPSTEAYAADINDSGVVVGTMRGSGGFGNYHGYIYADGVVTSLNSLIPAGSGLDLSVALGINNGGQIVGYAYDASARYHAFLLTPVAAGTPVLSIGDASAVTEGHTGTASATFTVSLSPSSSQAVTVSYSTANGSAAAGSDYQSASGTLTFAPGQTTQTISVLVNGDRAGESNETFFVALSQANGAVIGDGQGIGTIVDDEPRLSIDDVTRNEGQNGTTNFVFTVTLSPASDAAVSVNFATSDGSAKAGEDYDARSGTLAFSAGQTSKTIVVAVRGDRKAEATELFGLNLSGATGAFIADGQGLGMVRNDDK